MARFSRALKAITSFVIKKLSRSESRSLGYAHWPEPDAARRSQTRKSRSLGYAHWPELVSTTTNGSGKSRSLGYAHWPEPRHVDHVEVCQSRSLGYAHWPELLVSAPLTPRSLDHWDMRTGRNFAAIDACMSASLDHWDMRTGRN